ncbi:MAG TPA: hypothetical protein VED87_04380 [Methylocystis sp.]|nr:hypothetical protein [Methylocystis sp.]
MTFSKFAAGTAILLALTAAAPADAQVMAPYGAGPGWWGRPGTPRAYPYHPRYYGYARGAPGWQPYWSGEQQQHVAPGK